MANEWTGDDPNAEEREKAKKEAKARAKEVNERVIQPGPVQKKSNWIRVISKKKR